MTFLITAVTLQHGVTFPSVIKTIFTCNNILYMVSKLRLHGQFSPFQKSG